MRHVLITLGAIVAMAIFAFPADASSPHPGHGILAARGFLGAAPTPDVPFPGGGPLAAGETCFAFAVAVAGFLPATATVFSSHPRFPGFDLAVCGGGG